MSGGPIATLAAGAEDTTTFTAVYVITQADIDAGQYTNQATASGTAPDGTVFPGPYLTDEDYVNGWNTEVVAHQKLVGNPTHYLKAIHRQDGWGMALG